MTTVAPGDQADHYFLIGELVCLFLLLEVVHVVDFYFIIHTAMIETVEAGLFFYINEVWRSFFIMGLGDELYVPGQRKETGSSE